MIKDVSWPCLCAPGQWSSQGVQAPRAWPPNSLPLAMPFSPNSSVGLGQRGAGRDPPAQHPMAFITALNSGAPWASRLLRILELLKAKSRSEHLFLPPRCRAHVGAQGYVEWETRRPDIEQRVPWACGELASQFGAPRTSPYATRLEWRVVWASLLCLLSSPDSRCPCSGRPGTSATLSSSNSCPRGITPLSSKRILSPQMPQGPWGLGHPQTFPWHAAFTQEPQILSVQ